MNCWKYNYIATLENSLAVRCGEHILTICPSNVRIPWCLCKRNENFHLHRNLDLNIYINFIHYQASLVVQLVKNPPVNAGDLDSIPGLERSPGEGKGYPLQYSGLENSMDCSPWSRKELDTTEQLSLPFTSLPLILIQCIFYLRHCIVHL